MSKSNVKILQCKQNIWKGNYNKGYLKNGDVDNDLSFEEDLDNIDNGNKGDDDVDESSSDNEEILKLIKKEVDEFHVNDLIDSICENQYF